LRGMGHARNRFHPLFQGRRHGASSKFLRHASGRRCGRSGAQPRFRQQIYTETKSLRHAGSKRKLSPERLCREATPCFCSPSKQQPVKQP
jgi:hypothetical protein